MSAANATDTARGNKAVVRQLGLALGEVLLSAALLGVRFFVLTTATDSVKAVLLGGAGGFLVAAVLAVRFRIRVRDGRVTVTELWRRPQSVDLTRLTGVTAPGGPESFRAATVNGQRRYLELRDDRGSVVRLGLFGTRRGPRRRLLAALEPYVLAGGVSRTGLVREALDGQLWWPRPRPRDPGKDR